MRNAGGLGRREAEDSRMLEGRESDDEAEKEARCGPFGRYVSPDKNLPENDERDFQVRQKLEAPRAACSLSTFE